MEIPTPPPPPPAAISAAATTVKTPDPESEPPQSNTITKQPPTPITNGVLKRHKPLLHHYHHHQPPPVVVAYRECLKNHAAAMGSHAIDGCGEFMPSPTSSPTSPTSLKCAACGCHRNFHRREPDESLFNPPPIQRVIEYQPHHRHRPPPPPPQPILPPTAARSPGNSPSPPPISSSYYPSAPHMLLALSTGLSAPPAENNHTNHNTQIPSLPTTPGSGGSNPNGKKRFRTKFTQDQKLKMLQVAERVGWKMQKRDEELIAGLCNEIGVDKNVFKVWMHNNKTTIGNKKDFTNNIININDNNNCSGEGFDFIISRNNHHHHDTGNNHHLHLNNGDSFSTGGNVILSTKGSSSSS